METGNRVVYSKLNQAARDLTDIPLDDILGKTAEELFPGEPGRFSSAKHQMAWHQCRQVVYEHALPLKQGLQSFRSTICPVLNTEGQPEMLVISTTDLTTERMSQVLANRAESQNNEIKHFVHMAAHDLRSPLLNIKSIADILLSEAGNSAGGNQEMLQLLQRVADSSVDLISDMLEAASQSILQRDQSVFNLAELARDIHSVLDPMGMHHVTCQPVAIRSDKTLVQMVMRNLLDNAMKHGGRDHLHITVSGADSSKKHFVEIVVCDTGKGFKAGKAVIDENKKDRHACGFGLAGVRKMLHEHEGEVSFDNVDDERGGAKVTFTLPGRVEDNLIAHLAQAS